MAMRCFGRARLAAIGARPLLLICFRAVDLFGADLFGADLAATVRAADFFFAAALLVMALLVATFLVAAPETGALLDFFLAMRALPPFPVGKTSTICES